jgi:SAM-dependent methyltransferase
VSYLVSRYKKEVIRFGGVGYIAWYGRAHKYKPTSLKLMSRVGLGGWILDVGGGERSIGLPNFVNLDRVAYSGFVTVVGDAHFLPFKDEAFDLVLCEAVIEHLRKPWIAVEEFYRVLKPGGYIYADVAFMQPVHSYPSHYFNMTMEGVKVLFEKFEEVESGVQEYQMPSYTLLYVISRYVRGLLPWLDRQSENIEFYDTGTYIFHKSWVSSFLASLYGLFARCLRCLDRLLKPERAIEIAAGVYYIGRKQR